MGLQIKHIEYYLPEKIETNQDLQNENPDWDMAKIEEKSGVAQRHIVEGNETGNDLAIKAVEKIFAAGVIRKEDIQGIIFCTQSADYIMPSNSFLVHRHFGFSEDVWSYDFDLACSGYIFGLTMCRGFIETGVAKNILLITAETYSKYINKKDRAMRVLFGDGATASIITDSNESAILDVYLSSSGATFDEVYIPAGGCKVPASIETKIESADFSGNLKSPENINMNGFAVWKFISRKVPEQISKLLQRNNLSVNDIDMFMLHQASKMTLDSLIKALGIPEEKTFSTLKNIGNTSASTVPIGLKEAEIAGKIKRGDLLLLSGYGAGLSWGSLILRY